MRTCSTTHLVSVWVLFSPQISKRENQPLLPPCVNQVHPPALILIEQSALNTIFTHYPGCGWHDVICAAGSEEAYWGVSQSVLTLAESLLPDSNVLLFSYELSAVAAPPTPIQRAVTMNGNQPSISLPMPTVRDNARSFILGGKKHIAAFLFPRLEISLMS